MKHPLPNPNPLFSMDVIFRMPLTPVTALLFDQTYVKEQWPILGSRLEFKKHVPNFKQECDAHPGNWN